MAKSQIDNDPELLEFVQLECVRSGICVIRESQFIRRSGARGLTYPIGDEFYTWAGIHTALRRLLDKGLVCVSTHTISPWSSDDTDEAWQGRREHPGIALYVQAHYSFHPSVIRGNWADDIEDARSGV